MGQGNDNLSELGRLIQVRRILTPAAFSLKERRNTDISTFVTIHDLFWLVPIRG